MRKFFTVLAALAMSVGISTTAWAAEPNIEVSFEPKYTLLFDVPSNDGEPLNRIHFSNEPIEIVEGQEGYYETPLNDFNGGTISYGRAYYTEDGEKLSGRLVFPVGTIITAEFIDSNGTWYPGELYRGFIRPINVSGEINKIDDEALEVYHLYEKTEISSVYPTDLRNDRIEVTLADEMVGDMIFDISPVPYTGGIALGEDSADGANLYISVSGGQSASTETPEAPVPALPETVTPVPMPEVPVIEAPAAVQTPVTLPAPAPVQTPAIQTPVTLPAPAPVVPAVVTSAPVAPAVVVDESVPFPVGSTAVVDNCYMLNVRKGAGASHAAFTYIVEGDVITVLEYNSNKWVKISTPKGEGWIYSGYLTRQ